MTNAWSFLHDELYGESKMTESLDDRISPSIARNDGSLLDLVEMILLPLIL